jgi:hypothetical protein
MNIGKMLWKGVLGFLTYQAGTIANNPAILTGKLPENIAGMTIGGAVTAIVVMIANFVKNWKK